MHQRITSWPAIGLIYNFAQCSDEMLQEFGNIFSQENFSYGSGDRTLAGFLALERADPVFANIAGVFKGNVERDVGHLNALISAARAVPKDSINKCNVQFYTKKTVVGFHHLLVGCFILYARTLAKLNGQRVFRRKRPDEKPNEKVILGSLPADGTRQRKIVGLFIDLEQYTRLLLFILSSKTFSTHLGIVAGILKDDLLPSRRNQLSYDSYKAAYITGPLMGIDTGNNTKNKGVDGSEGVDEESKDVNQESQDLDEDKEDLDESDTYIKVGQA